MSKLLKNFVGIDISKLFFDVALLKEDQPGQIFHQQFKQTPYGFSEMKEWLKKMDVFLDELRCFAWNIPEFTIRH